MKTIIVSAGHSDNDSGAVNGQYREEDLAQWLRNRVATLLRADGRFNVQTDGDGAENKSLPDAIRVLKANSGAIPVEFHFNAGPALARGVEVLAKPSLKVQSQRIAQAISTITGSPLRGNMGWKPDNSGQHHRLAFCDAGGMVVEVEFISNLNALQVYIKLREEVAISLANTLRDIALGA